MISLYELLAQLLLSVDCPVPRPSLSRSPAVGWWRFIRLALVLTFVVQTMSLFPSRLAAQESASGGSTGKGNVAVSQDVSAGDPQASEGPGTIVPSNFIEAALAMGPLFLLAFVCCSVVTLWIVIERLIVLRRGRVIPRHFVDRFIENLEQGTLEPEKALSLCEEHGSPVAAMFAHGIRKWGKPSIEIEQAMIDGGERQVSHLRNHLRILNSVATIAPLLGLLGTVFGMIKGFNELARTAGGGREDQLAGAIAIALLTTAAGLFVAIPTLVIYTYLAGRIDSLVMELDKLSQEVVHLISAEALADRALSGSRERSRRTASPPAAEPKERKAV